MEKLNKKASTLLINYGDSQVIKHLHLHILPTALHEKNTLSEDEIYQKLKDEI